jgi:hypothetical protein
VLTPLLWGILFTHFSAFPPLRDLIVVISTVARGLVPARTYEAGRNVEVMWFLGRLTPDHKTIVGFPKDNRTPCLTVKFCFIARPHYRE